MFDLIYFYGNADVIRINMELSVVNSQKKNSKVEIHTTLDQKYIKCCFENVKKRLNSFLTLWLLFRSREDKSHYMIENMYRFFDKDRLFLLLIFENKLYLRRKNLSVFLNFRRFIALN